MLFALRRLFRRPPIRMGYVDDGRQRRSPVRTAGFVSFFAGSDCVSRRNSDVFDQRLRRQKVGRAFALVAVTALCTWFVIESAYALSTF